MGQDELTPGFLIRREEPMQKRPWSSMGWRFLAGRADSETVIVEADIFRLGRWIRTERDFDYFM